MQDEFIKLAGKFPLGRTMVTSGALAALTPDDILASIRRHCAGDWGELDPPDRAHNDMALETEGRLLSRYHSLSGVVFYIITEWDRSATTVLLVHEY